MRLQQLEQQLVTVDAAFMVVQRREGALQVEVQRLTAAAASGPALVVQQRAAATRDTHARTTRHVQRRRFDMAGMDGFVISDRVGTLMQAIEDGSSTNLRRATLTNDDPAHASQL